MKKIGILFGAERSFPEAFVKRVNETNIKGINGEFVIIDKLLEGKPLDYAVIIDRISYQVPFYRVAMKNAAITGTAVINNPLCWNVDEKFFPYALAKKIGLAVPRTALIPSYDQPDHTSDQTFMNLAFPLDWDAIFEYIGFPAYMKPLSGQLKKEVLKLFDKEDFFDKHKQTGRTVMMLQEQIIFDDYFKCYCVGGKHVHIVQYEPRNPFHLRYAATGPPASKKLLKRMHDHVLKLNQYLGYDINCIDFAVRGGIPYAIDLCNLTPEVNVESLGQETFDWQVQTTAAYAIERAKRQLVDQDNLTWPEYIKTASLKIPAMKAKSSK